MNGPGATAAAGWAGALDAFEARLAEQAALLDAGEAGDIPPYAPPAGLGPCPPDLVDRAARLLDRALGLEARLAATLLLTTGDLAAVRRSRAGRGAGSRGEARFLDRSV